MQSAMEIFRRSSHLAENMTLRLKQMADYLPKSWRGQLMELTARLENGLQAGSRTENLKLLQGEIIPYLGSYVERTHDIGEAEDSDRTSDAGCGAL